MLMLMMRMSRRRRQLVAVGGNLGSEGARVRGEGEVNSIPTNPTRGGGGGGGVINAVKDKREWLIPGYFVKSQTNQRLSRGRAIL